MECTPSLDHSKRSCRSPFRSGAGLSSRVCLSALLVALAAMLWRPTPLCAHSLSWSGRSAQGRVPNGVYFFRCATPGRVFVSRIAIVS